MESVPSFDVVIAGAGPAGTLCAHLLAKHDLNVLLLDRAVFPRDKTCGDGITPRGARLLADVGLLDAVLPHARPNKGVVIRGEGQQFRMDFKEADGAAAPLLVVPRLALDAALLTAVSANAPRLTVWQDTKVLQVIEPMPGKCEVRLSDGRTVEAPVAVIATGAESQLLRASNLIDKKPALEHAARVYFKNIEKLPDDVVLFFDGVDLPGYGWIFPSGEGTANIGCGAFDAGATPQADRLRTLIASHPLLTGLLEGAVQDGPIKVYPLRTDFSGRYAGHGNRLCIGEAAGLVNPVTGEGIDYAFESARFAAEVIVRGFSGGKPGDLVAPYRRRLVARFDRRFRVYRWIQRHLLSPQNTQSMLRTMDGAPALRRLVLDGLFGHAKLSSFFSPRVLWPALRLAIASRKR